MKLIDQSVRIIKPATKELADSELKNAEYAGRNCYDSYHKLTDTSFEEFIPTLVSRHHLSPLEFADMTVEMIVGRDVMAEITRHRLASFAVRSQRYVADDKSGEISFIKPDFYVPAECSVHDDDWCASRDWEQDMEYIERRYKRYKDFYGLKNQQRRVILPNSTATVIVMKANLREWMHIFELRDSSAAYPKMAEIMYDLHKKAAEIYPVVFQRE